MEQFIIVGLKGPGDSPNQDSRNYFITSYSHHHGAADFGEEVETLLVGEQRVPDSDDVWQGELLREQQRHPSGASRHQSSVARVAENDMRQADYIEGRNT